MARLPYEIVMETISMRPAECGGLLLGPIGSNDVTGFHLDEGGSLSATTYEPDIPTLKSLMRWRWQPQGVDMKGIVHSHPPGYDRLSPGDLRYIHRLLTINDDMDAFMAPVVLPDQFRFVPFIVLRGRPGKVVRAQLEFI